MAVFRVEKTRDYTVMANHHLKNKDLSLKSKGLLSQMLSLPEDWDYTLKGLSMINRESIDAIREAVRELEQAGYIIRSRERNEYGHLKGTDYTIFEKPHLTTDSTEVKVPVSEKPVLGKPMLENPILDNPVDEIVDLMVETLCSEREFITVAGDDYPTSLVKERLQRIDSTHIEYIYECLDKNTTFIRNIKKYLLTTLFNAPATIDSYYTALVKHDLYGPGSHFYEDLGNLIKSNE